MVLVMTLWQLSLGATFKLKMTPSLSSPHREGCIGTGQARATSLSLHTMLRPLPSPPPATPCFLLLSNSSRRESATKKRRLRPQSTLQSQLPSLLSYLCKFPMGSTHLMKGHNCLHPWHEPVLMASLPFALAVLGTPMINPGAQC